MARLLSFYTLAYSRETFRRIILQIYARHFDDNVQKTDAESNSNDYSDANSFSSFRNQLINHFLGNGGRAGDFHKALRAAAHLVRQTDCVAADRQCEICAKEHEKMAIHLHYSVWAC